MTRSQEKPLCLSLIICDAVHAEPLVDKRHILGSINCVVVPRVPVVPSQLCVQIGLTNARGTYQMRLLVEHEETGLIVHQTREIDSNMVITVNSPMDVLEMTVTITKPYIQQYGRYWFRLYADDELIAQRALIFEAAAPAADATEPATAGVAATAGGPAEQQQPKK